MANEQQSTAQHTPGSWQVVVSDDGETYICDGEPQPGNLFPRPIFVLMRDDDEAHADAALGAAAPELLGVCRAMLQRARFLGIDGEIISLRAERAIAKATGQAVRNA